MSKKISAIITCGGCSTRFGSNKLLEKLNDKTVIETTILKFLPLVDEIVIPITSETKEFLEKSDIMCEKIKFCQNGSTRQKSVYNGLNCCDNPNIVLIHDGARPFIEQNAIKEIIQETFLNHAVVAGYKAIDTIKQIDDKGKIVKTIDRNYIFHAQTPQAFDFALIKKIHEFYKNKDDFTDDSSMAEAYGIDVFCYFGSKNNRKITNREDLIQ